MVKQWVEKHYYDWIGEDSIIDQFDSFLDECAKYSNTSKMADQLKAAIVKKVSVDHIVRFF